MRTGIFNIALKSVKYHRRQVIYQVLIILLLSAVITGSLMTGKSVRTSLKRSAVRKLGNTSAFISSGLRYFDPQLAVKLEQASGLKCTGILELRGSSMGLVSQQASNNTAVFAVGNDFFGFHNIDSIHIDPGNVIINTRLAKALQVKAGDDIIIRFRNISDIPSDAPFAPSADENTSIVMKVGKIADGLGLGDFSLTISQVTSPNVFMNISDLVELTGKNPKINRLLIAGNKPDTASLKSLLKKTIEPADAGLHIREIHDTGGSEIISDRVFIDDILIDEIKNQIGSAEPLITYLANKIEKNGRINPYSFVSAVPSGIYPHVPSQNGIIITDWLARDIGATRGDTVQMSWYAPDSLNKLFENEAAFTVDDVIPMNDILVDSLLMPDFPGIAASESCSAWDAGIPVKTNLIRDKDEDYWDRYKGTPKAFINYETGKKLWGSNYGPATSVRFPVSMTAEEINMKLSGSLDPETLGFTVNDIYNESLRAAEESVDFGTLFISLGFFLILASFVLLSFAVSYYFEIRKNEVRILYSIGYRNSTISNLFLYETAAIAFIGCLLGSLAGYAVNVILITALNSVWTGAVQTNTLIPSFDGTSVLTGFASTLALTLLFMFLKIRKFLKFMNIKGAKRGSLPSSKWNVYLLAITLSMTLILFVLSFISDDRITLSFVAGSMLLASMILFWRLYYVRGRRKLNLSASFYSHNPSDAVTPVLFIAAGIFAVFITAVNRKNFPADVNDKSSGTGGYLLWMETSIPVSDDLNSVRGRSSLGLDDNSLASMQFVAMKRSQGNDASCLNLNHITAPPLLAVDPGFFIQQNAFSFTKTIKKENIDNPWRLLETPAGVNSVYGIADQTVLDWGLKISVGDTLVLRSESGQPLNIIIAAGLQSSVFQGFVLTGKEYFSKYYPSASGNSVFLVSGQDKNAEKYKTVLQDRLSGFGTTIENTSDRLASFYEITNTYLSVFGVFGGLGMITGIAGLGFVLLRNYSRRKREFALMLAVGFTPPGIRKMVFLEQLLILSSGVFSGVIPALIATLPSLSSNHEIPWIYLVVIILTIFITGLLASMLSVRSIKGNSLIGVLRKE